MEPAPPPPPDPTAPPAIAAQREPPPLPTASAPTKRRRRSEAEIQADKDAKESRRLAREKSRQERVAAQKAKEVEKAVRVQLAKENVAEKTTRFFWTEGATADLLDLIATLKNEHDTVNDATPGFISWNKFFKANSHIKTKYESLRDLPDDTLDRRYKALLTSYRAVRDSCAATGGGGFHDQLRRYNLSEQSYNSVGELHENNAALNFVGGAMPGTASDDDEAGAPVSQASDHGEGTGEGEAEIPWSDSDVLDDAPGVSGDGGPPAPSTPAQAGARGPSTSAAGCSRPSGTPDGRAPPRTAVPASNLAGAVPTRPPSAAAAAARSVRVERRRTNQDAVDTINRAQESMDSGLNSMVALQHQAAEREAERDARREEREARLEEARAAREAQRDRDRHEWRMAERARQERDDQQRSIMNMMMMRMFGAVVGRQGASSQGDGNMFGDAADEQGGLDGPGGAGL